MRPHSGVVGVTLDLAARPRQPGQRPIAKGNRIPRVLPALILETGFLVASLIGDVAIPHPVAIVVEPFEGRAGRLFELADQVAVACPQLVFVEQYQEQRRRVGAAEIWRMRPFGEGRHLSDARLVEDLSRLFVAERVDAGSLPRREDPKGGRGQ